MFIFVKNKFILLGNFIKNNFLLILVFCSAFLYAGEPSTVLTRKIDEKINLIAMQAVEDIYNDKYIHQLNVVNEESKKINYSRGILNSYFLKNYIYNFRGDNEKLLKSFGELDSKFLVKKPENDNNINSFYWQLGGVFLDLGFHERSIDYLKEGISKLTHKDDFAFQFNTDIAYNYGELKNYRQYLYHIKEAEGNYIRATPQSVYYKNPDYRYYIDSFYALAYSNLKKFGQANHYLNLTRKNLKNVHSMLLNIYNNLSDTEVNYKNYNQAWDDIFNAKKYYEEVNVITLSSDLELSQKILNLSILTKRKDSIEIYTKKVEEIKEKIKERDRNAKDFALNWALNDEIKKDKNEVLKYVVSAVVLSVSAGILVFLYLKKKKKSRYNSKTIENNEEELSTENKIFQNNIEPKTVEFSNEKFIQLNELARANSPEFLTLFQELYPNFMPKILDIDPKTNITELRFYAYLFLNFSTKDIAQFTNTSIRTVQTKKSNIRKKLNIPSGEDVYLWFGKLMN